MTVVGGSTDHLIVDRLGNVQADAVLEVQTLAGAPVTDVTAPTGWTGQAFPAGQARADANGYFTFVVPDATGPVQVRTAAYTVGTRTFAAGPWLTPSGQIVPDSALEQALAAMATDADIADAVATQAAADSATYARKDAAPVSVAAFGVLPSATAADNVTGLAAAVASGATNLWFPAGTYNIQVTDGDTLMSFVGKKHIRIAGDNAVLNDTTVYSSSALTIMALFDACKDVVIEGVEYVGPVLATPATDLGYRGATLVRAINGTTGLRVDMRATNCRHGVQAGDYDTAATGYNRGIDAKISGSMIGYPVAFYLTEAATLDIDVDGVHRGAYLAGCRDIRGVVRFRDQYVADAVALVTDSLTSGTDAAAQADPVGSPTTSRGCENIDVQVIDKGSTVFQPSSVLAAIGLQRVDACSFRSIKLSVHVVGDDALSTKIGAARISSAAKTVWSRYPFNWEPGIVLEDISISGLSDHSAATVIGSSGGDLSILTQDGSAAHAATMRGLRVDLDLWQSVGNYGDTTIQAPGLATPMHLRLNQPGVRLNLLTNATIPTVLDRCKIATLDPTGVTGGSRYVLGAGTVVTGTVPGTDMANASTEGGTSGGVGVAVQQKEIVLTLAGAAVTWAGAIPANTLVLAVRGRLYGSITGASGYQVGVAAEAARYADSDVLTSGTTFTTGAQSATEISPRYYAASTNIVVTAKTADFTGAQMRVVLNYITFPAATS